jgi:hypothetical protein
LRPVKRLRVICVAEGDDDPDDDETSDDPADDDDVWEGVNDFGETETPGSALFHASPCYQGEQDVESEPDWSAPASLPSFLRLQRLRC